MSTVLNVSKNAKHEFSKNATSTILLIKDEGVEGDAHRGVTVKHRSRVIIDPTKPNLRQVHFFDYETIKELQIKGFNVNASSLGENITTLGIDLLSLPAGTILKIGTESQVEITGLRNPCVQLDEFQKGLMSALLDRDENGTLIRKAGIMGIVLNGGIVRVGDNIDVQLPPKPYKPLEKV